MESHTSWGGVSLKWTPIPFCLGGEGSQNGRPHIFLGEGSPFRGSRSPFFFPPRGLPILRQNKTNGRQDSHVPDHDLDSDTPRSEEGESRIEETERSERSERMERMERVERVPVPVLSTPMTPGDFGIMGAGRGREGRGRGKERLIKPLL